MEEPMAQRLSLLPRLIGLIYALQLFAGIALGGEVVRLKNQKLHLKAQVLEVPSHSTTARINPRFLPTLDRVYYIVQFTGPVRPEWKTELTGKGISLNSYLPDDAFIAQIKSPEAWLALNGFPFVRAIVPYETEFRISSELKKLEASAAATVKILVRLTDSQELLPFVKVTQDRGISTVIHQITGRMVLLETLPKNIQGLADIEGVEWIEMYTPIDTMEFDIYETPEERSAKPKGDYTDLTGYETGTKLMGFDQAHARGLTGFGEVIGIADSGLDKGSVTDIQADFRNQILKGYALGMFAEGWQDFSGHGTHTAGSIVGTGAYSRGLLRGGAFGAKLVMEGMWSPLAGGGLSVPPKFDRVIGMLYKEHAAAIHSNSWGSRNTEGRYTNLSAAVDEVSWQYPELLVVFAAGNSGVDMNRDGLIDGNSVTAPATAKNCLTVGASKNLLMVGGVQKKIGELTTLLPDGKIRETGKIKWGAEPLNSSRHSDNPNGIAAFSGIGPTNDGRIKPEVVAPGTNVLSVRSRVKNASTMWGVYNENYVYSGGTSMATPLTSAAAAVLRQWLKNLGITNPSAALVKALLIHSSKDLYPGQFGFGKGQEMERRRPNMNQGFGRVNVAAFLEITKNSIVDDPLGLKTGEVKTFKINAVAGQKVTATLVYTDAPASSGAEVTLVNNLDLSITDSSGMIRYPNHRTSPDDVNNSEMVEFIPSQSGPLTIAVEAKNIPVGRDGSGAQPYALVMTGAGW
jgi:serine protease AprX